MEFFAIAEVATSPEAIREQVTLPTLPGFCESIALVDCLKGDRCEVESVWGRFQVVRQEIAGGLRFTLPDCPNCFAWTITTGLPPVPGKVVIHGTINRPDHEPWFIDSLAEFMQQWKEGLERQPAGGSVPGPKPGRRSMPGLKVLTP